MFCINNDCECYGTDLGDDNFCGECGAKCVNESPTAVNEKQSSVIDSRSSFGVGVVKNIVAGDQHNSTINTGLNGVSYSPHASQSTAPTKNIIGGNQHISTTTVLNQDETKTVRVCAISGRQAIVVEGYVCPSCSNWVHLDYFNSESRMCTNCFHQRSGDITQSFRTKVQAALDDGVITKDEIIDLKQYGTNLGISEERQNEILKEARTEQKSDKPLSTPDRIKLKTAMSQLCKRESTEERLAAFKSLKVLQKNYPSDLKIASLLVLSAAVNSKKEINFDVISFAIDILNQCPAFAFDSPEKHMISVAFYRSIGFLLNSGVALAGPTQELIERTLSLLHDKGISIDQCERYKVELEAQKRISDYYNLTFNGKKYQQEADNLESLFPESPESQAVQIAALLDHFFETGELPEIHQEISKLLQAIDNNPDGSSPQQAIAMLCSSWSVGNLAFPPPDNVDAHNAEALLLYELLFSWNLNSLRQAEINHRDANLAQFKNAPMAGKVIALRIPKTSVSLEFCGCPAGSFLMGSTYTSRDDYFCNTDEGINLDWDGIIEGKERRVPVRFAQGFWIGRTTITFEQWNAVAGENPHAHDQCKKNGMPASLVSWTMAAEFCERLNNMGLVPERWAFSLPTEAQWEYACRAGTTGLHAGKSLDKLGWYCSNSGYCSDSEYSHIPHPVAKKAPNDWGIYDMHGNVEEFCLDWYSKYLNPDVTKQGQTPGTSRVVRGGCFGSGAEDCRSAKRNSIDDDCSLCAYYGFRICIVKV